MKIIGVLSVIVLLVVLSPVLLIGSFLAYNTWHTYTHRVRLTVEVETPTGLKSGSGVILWSGMLQCPMERAVVGFTACWRTALVWRSEAVRGDCMTAIGTIECAN
jgi:hypothetical protein